MKDFFSKVYEIVSQIPAGCVATYGQIAAIIGEPKSARIVGWAMRSAPPSLPCHRVVNKSGNLSPDYVFGSKHIQKSMLESEGITFKEDGTIDMEKCLWRPDFGHEI